MLDDGDRSRLRRIELGDKLIGRVGVVDVVVGKLFALNLHRGRHAEAPLARAVEGGPLMRVLPIAQRLREFARDRARAWRVIVLQVGKPCSDRRIVRCRPRIGTRGERLAQGRRRRAVMRVHIGEHARIVRRIDNDGDAFMVLRAGADEGRAADIDILDAGGEIAACPYRHLERIEIDDEEIDRRDGMILQRALMRLVAAHREQAAMDLRVQRLHAPVHHLRHACDLGDIDDFEPGFAQQLRRSAGGDQLHAARAQAFGEIGKARLVAHREEGAGDLSRGHGGALG